MAGSGTSPGRILRSDFRATSGAPPGNVVPANAAAILTSTATAAANWIPAYAGMTSKSKEQQPMPIRAILTDIEGTTSSISFVKDVLFPYARRALPAFVAARGKEPGVRRWLDMVATENGGICNDDVIVETLQGWIDQDRKHTALKALQGMLWRDGYMRGDFRGHVYPDAVAALRDWHSAGHRLAVFSSGSVDAQKLLFGHSEAGDLSALFSGWFDTQVGHKREADSYRQIAAAL